MIDTTQQFQQIYQRLNERQKLAVDTIDGPVMVVAGPGTGKTQVLAARIASILLKTDTNPASILALTYTESAAKEMRERLVSMIGKTGYYVQITTFHSFCSAIIQSHPEYFPIDRGSEPLTDLERYDLYQSIISELSLEILKPLNRPLLYLTEAMRSVSDLKREGFLPEDFAKIIEQEAEELAAQEKDLKKIELQKKQRNLAKHRELLEIYLAYQRRLRASFRYDYDDMIALVVAAFQQEELLLREFQENLLYFLVDEYQDTNSAQNKVVDLLASYWGEQANIFVVGDPNQSIYRFQGASIENVLGFAHRYPTAQVITLEKGYRCPQLIYNAAAKIIRNNNLTDADQNLAGFSFTEPLQSQHDNGGSLIGIYEAPSQTLETVYVAEKILQLHQEQQVPLDEIAVLYRNNRDAVEIRETLDRWDIRYEIDGGNNLLENEAIRQLLSLMQVIADVRSGQEDETLFEVMRYEWLDLDRVLVMKLGRAAGKSRQAMIDLIEQGQIEFAKLDIGPEVTPLEFEQLTQFLTKLRQWGALDATVIFPEWFETVVKESGFLDWILGQELKTDLLINLNSLFREVKALAGSDHTLNLAGFLLAIQTMRDHGIKINVEDLNVKEDAVHLSTVHKAKGREWQHVFVLHCLDGKWGNVRTRDLLPLPEALLENTDLSKKEQNEDERRLFYVALTRAKESAVITYPATIISDNKSKEVVGSMFIEELREEGSELKVELLQLVAPEIESNADDYLAKLVMPRQSAAVLRPTEEEFFAGIVKDFKLSVTALNAYLRDPEEFVQNVLLKVPRAKPEPMAFGSAMHAALEKMGKHLQQHGELPPEKMILDEFEQALTRELLTSDDFQRRLQHGHDLLRQYLTELSSQTVKPVFIERFFGYGWSKTILGDIQLTGRIDRVDWLDQTKKIVRVIDYKTGKPKSVNFIEGQVKSVELSEREQQLPDNIKGPYKRQLLFYKLLTELDQTFIPTVAEGVFEFLEPNTSGKLVTRRFELLEEDVEALKNLIREVMAEIRELKFLQ